MCRCQGQGKSAGSDFFLNYYSGSVIFSRKEYVKQLNENGVELGKKVTLLIRWAGYY